ncbi:MAG TPA: AMP-binding protein [Jatrophihabitans sp.]|nr:AMP-binding protein [Jatrophihabitans sp.]
MSLASEVAKLPFQLTKRVSIEGLSALTLLRAGAFGFEPPQRLAQVLLAFQRNGPAGAALEVARRRHGTRTAIIDEQRSLSFDELEQRSQRLAVALRAAGFRDGDSVGLLCRNHAGLFEALFAAAKLGARTVLLNTDFGRDQLADVCTRERIGLLLHDEEFEPAAESVEADRYYTDGTGGSSIDALIRTAPATRLPRPTYGQQIVLLTSGTTGTPKGAAREFGISLAIPGGYLSRIPLRSQENVLVAVPVFHAWGLLSSVIALALADTLVLRRHARAAELADGLQRYGCDALVTVPIVLSRLLAELAENPRQLPALRVVAVSGSALEPDLARRARSVLGDVLYNLYGSTEVAYASIATPTDLAEAPGSVGKPPFGTTVRILDDSGAPAPAGTSGRIFVGSTLQFGGYTGGGSKEQVGGLMATGDLGHLDEHGRLWIDGRDDDMIVSGGENVFPGEVEHTLAAHPDVLEAAVVAVPDPEFGQRLRAFVVLRAGAALPAEELKAHVKQRLARFKVPRDVVFVPELPRNPAGKVVKRELPQG